jgi:CspA family cold shock protein
LRPFAILPAWPACPLTAFRKNTPNPDSDLRKWLCGPQTHLCVFKETNMASGTVKFFNSQKGFGFIQQENGGPDVFVHVSAVERAGMRGLAEGQKLTFDIEADRKSGKSAATNLQAA